MVEINFMNRLNLKNGLSGLIRARNEAKFISLCIDSCIDALDELIVVYNDCSDKTEEILEEKVKQYPGKLKIFPFNHNIFAYSGGYPFSISGDIRSVPS